jgi:hypothetical protein
MNHQENIPERDIYDYNKVGTIYSAVSLESFFIGNEDESSIAYSLTDHPGLQFFYELLQKIRTRVDVEDVWIQVSRVEIMEIGGQYMWPYSDRVLIVTSATETEVSRWVEPLKPNAVKECLGNGGTLASSIHYPDGYKVFALLWQ